MKRAEKSKRPAPPPRAAAPSLLAKLPGFFAAALTSLATIAALLPLDTAAAQWNNVLPLMLLIVLLVAWMVAGFARGTLTIKWDAATIALLVLTALPLVSAAGVIISGTGNARLAANLSWQWLGFGMLFFYARQVLARSADVRMLAAVMLALAAGLSVFAMAQYVYLMPQARAEYKKDPDAMLAQAEIYAPEGTPQRRHFEDRLESKEPTATFALTNSLAGFLTPWLGLAVGLIVIALAKVETRRQAIGVAVIALVLSVTLVLTKSRTATLAVMGGSALAILYLTPLGKRVDVRIPLGLGLAGVLVLIVGIVSGGLDTEVLSEAPKSVLYRFQYWQATAAMIAEHPWLGCGPGNFQDAYLKYQLPEASENIADPHNFALEVWATSGTLAALAMAAAIVLLVLRVRQAAQVTEVIDDAPPTAGWQAHLVALLVGVALAYGLGLIVGLMPDYFFALVGLPAMVLVLWTLRPWIERGETSLALLVAPLVALLINLLAAGGISFPGVATSVWLLVAMILTLCDLRVSPRWWQLPRTPAVLLLLATVLMGVAFHRLVYVPVLEGTALLNQAERATTEGRIDDALSLLEKASQADLYSPRPWMNQAALWEAQLVQLGDAPVPRERFNLATEEALLRDPRSASTRSQLGDWRLELYRRSGRADDLAAAIYNYREVVTRYPNSARGHAQLAWALHLAENDDEAALAAARALELDSQHDHGEYKLTVLRVTDFPPAMGLSQRPLSDDSAEQTMQSLRTSSTP